MVSGDTAVWNGKGTRGTCMPGAVVSCDAHPGGGHRVAVQLRQLADLREGRGAVLEHLRVGLQIELRGAEGRRGATAAAATAAEDAGPAARGRGGRESRGAVERCCNLLRGDRQAKKRTVSSGWVLP